MKKEKLSNGIKKAIKARKPFPSFIGNNVNSRKIFS